MICFLLTVFLILIPVFYQVSVKDSEQHTFNFPVHDWIKGQDEHELTVDNPLEGEGDYLLNGTRGVVC